MENKLNIIFENDDIIILNKQPFVYVFKEESIKKNTLLDYTQDRCKTKIYPITSLDFEASGLVLFAKNENTYNFIANQFKKEEIKKTYYILVNGIMENTEGEINKNLLITEQTTSINEKGVNAVTKYTVEEQFRNFAYVKAVPLTTHKNQIRAHFWAVGNSLAVDRIYGSDEPILLSNLKRRYKGISKEKPLLKRLPLHFYQIEFLLPNAKEKSIFTVELADDMKLTLKQLKKYNSRGLY